MRLSAPEKMRSTRAVQSHGLSMHFHVENSVLPKKPHTISNIKRAKQQPSFQLKGSVGPPNSVLKVLHTFGYVQLQVSFCRRTLRLQVARLPWPGPLPRRGPAEFGHIGESVPLPSALQTYRFTPVQYLQHAIKTCPAFSSHLLPLLFIHLFPLHFWNRVCFSCVPITKKVNYSNSCRADYYRKRRSLLTSEHTSGITQQPYHSFFPSWALLGNPRHLKV